MNIADQFKLPPSVLISQSAAEKIFAGPTERFAQVKEKAEAGGFISRDLNVTASISPRVTHETGTTSNVIESGKHACLEARLAISQAGLTSSTRPPKMCLWNS